MSYPNGFYNTYSGLEDAFRAEVDKNIPTQLFLELYKAGRKGNESGKQSKSCYRALADKGLGKIQEKRI